MKVFIAFLLLISPLSERAQRMFAPRPANCSGSGYVVNAAAGDSVFRSPEEITKVNLGLAADGNTEAEFNLALAYLQGEGVRQDLTLALRYFELGATKPDQKSIVADVYARGYCFPRSAEAAVEWYLKAGRTGDRFEAARIYVTSDPPRLDKAAEVYRALLTASGTPEVRRAEMELGNLVLDGKYSAGEDAEGRRLNLKWARTITQELLGQEEYKIAVDYLVGREGLAKQHNMWLRFCERAARYNIDLAQKNLGEAILNGEVAGTSPLEGYAWVRLASDKQHGVKAQVTAMEAHMTAAEFAEANSIFNGLQQTRVDSGAYYRASDPLNRVSSVVLAAMPDDDPDVQLRRAFLLESSADPEDYGRAMQLYRIARDRRKMDVRVVLGRDYLQGAHGLPKDKQAARFWLELAAGEGSEPARQLLRTMSEQASSPSAVTTQSSRGEAVRSALAGTCSRRKEFTRLRRTSASQPGLERFQGAF